MKNDLILFDDEEKDSHADVFLTWFESLKCGSDLIDEIY